MKAVSLLHLLSPQWAAAGGLETAEEGYSKVGGFLGDLLVRAQDSLVLAFITDGGRANDEQPDGACGFEGLPQSARGVPSVDARHAVIGHGVVHTE